MSRHLPFEEESGLQRWLRPLALLLAIGAHAVFGAVIWMTPPSVEKKDTWVRMDVVAPPPPPPPPPEPPKPEPEPPKPKAPKPAEKVAFKETVKEPPPVTDPTPKPRRLVQGLSASSFAGGAGPGLDVRAGTSLSTAATKEVLKPEEATVTASLAAATKAPSCDIPPPTVPDEVIEKQPQGKAKLLFDVSESGEIRNVRVITSLLASADAACVDAVKRAKRCKPGKQGDTAVTIVDVPYYCSFRALN